MTFKWGIELKNIVDFRVTMYLKGITAAFAMLDFFFPFFFFLKMVDKLLVSVNYKTVNSNIWLSVFR